jgi:hypothetical protein
MREQYQYSRINDLPISPANFAFIRGSLDPVALTAERTLNLAVVSLFRRAIGL